MSLGKSKRKADAGVTLLEVMIVLAIMALVIGLAAPRFIDSFGRAKSQSAQVQMGNLRAALQLYYVDVGTYPSPSQGLEALLRPPQGVSNWRGPYLDKSDGLIDPWGRRYELKTPGSERAFDLLSYGRDGKPGGSGEDADLLF